MVLFLVKCPACLHLVDVRLARQRDFIGGFIGVHDLSGGAARRGTASSPICRLSATAAPQEAPVPAFPGLTVKLATLACLLGECSLLQPEHSLEEVDAASR